MIKYSLPYATGFSAIRLSAHKRYGGIEITVEDNGSGNSSDLRNAALKRFGRLVPVRHIPGSGPSIALLSAVARLHSGQVRIKDNAPGLHVVILCSA